MHLVGEPWLSAGGSIRGYRERLLGSAGAQVQEGVTVATCAASWAAAILCLTVFNGHWMVFSFVYICFKFLMKISITFIGTSDLCAEFLKNAKNFFLHFGGKAFCSQPSSRCSGAQQPWQLVHFCLVAKLLGVTHTVPESALKSSCPRALEE